jgi:glutamate synthase (NADPH/NADH) small chain
MDVDLVVVAIGNSSNPLIPATTPGLETNRWDNIVVNDETMQTSREGVYAGGDIVTGGATVILAAGAGKKAARAMHQYLMEKVKK